LYFDPDSDPGPDLDEHVACPMKRFNHNESPERL